MTTDGDLLALRRAGDRFVGALGSIGPHDWTRSTPCEEWDLRALVDHVVGGNWFTCLVLGGHTADDSMRQTMSHFAGGSATSDQAVDSITDQYSAFDEPGVFERQVHHLAGELTGRQIIRLRLHDLIAHTWDVEQSLGHDSTIPGELVRWGLAELSRSDSLTASFFAYTEEFGRGGDADDYLRLLGRTS